MTERLEAARQRAAEHDAAETPRHGSVVEVLIQTVAEMDRGLRLLRAELDYAITGKHRKIEPMTTVDILEANLRVMDELVKHVTDREVDDARPDPGAGAGG